MSVNIDAKKILNMNDAGDNSNIGRWDASAIMKQLRDNQSLNESELRQLKSAVSSQKDDRDKLRVIRKPPADLFLRRCDGIILGALENNVSPVMADLTVPRLRGI